MAASSRSSSITDSPWFWAYLFGVGGLIALALASPKFGERQAQEERRLQGRERAAQQQAGVEMTGEISTPESTEVTLRPLFLGLAVLTSVAWLVFWLKRRGRLSGGAGCQGAREEACPIPEQAGPP